MFISPSLIGSYTHTQITVPNKREHEIVAKLRIWFSVRGDAAKEFGRKEDSCGGRSTAAEEEIKAEADGREVKIVGPAGRRRG